jgi:hypothetical protein
MRHFTTAVLERHREYQDDFQTEPFETAWASEAIFFLRVEKIEGVDTRLSADVQISADGIHWADEGVQFQPITQTGDQFVRVSHFGGWLRLAGRLEGEGAKITTTIHLVLKE